MRKSKVKTIKLASLLLLSTVLIPNTAYAEEETDESAEAERTSISVEVQNTEDMINEETDEPEENAETLEITPGEAAAYEVIPEDNNNDDIETDTGEEPVEDGGSNEETAPILEPAGPEEILVEAPAETEPVEETVPVPDAPAGEEETPEDAIPETQVPDNSEQEDIQDEPYVPELPTEQVVPAEPAQPVTEEEPAAGGSIDNSYEEENNVVNQPLTQPGNSEAAAEEDPSTIGTEKKKLYSYNYGDILNGITFDKGNIQENISMLDQRVTRVMSSKIIEEKDLTEDEKLELEEEVKSENVNTYGGEELPNTGEADSTNYAAAGLLTLLGAALLFMSKKLKTDN